LSVTLRCPVIIHFKNVSDNLRHFTDHLILARQEAEEEEEKGALEMLTETHIIQTISDIFFGLFSHVTISYFA